MEILRYSPFLGFALSPWCGSPLALGMGLFLSLGLGWQLPVKLKDWGRVLMQVSIVGLGFALNPEAVRDAGLKSISVTLMSLIGILLVARVVAGMLKVNKVTGSLIAAGTGICGGSAIAALSPVIGASSAETAISLATVFSLNAVALFVFPPLGHYLDLTPSQFGWWAAIAIHDTSSVVGAAAQFHPDSVAIAVTTKLTRALWIVPLVFAASFFGKKFNGESQSGRAKVPLFIILFILAVVLHGLLPDLGTAYETINGLGKAALKAAIFLIGAQLTRPMIRNVGVRALALGVILWAFMAISVLAWVRTI